MFVSHQVYIFVYITFIILCLSTSYLFYCLCCAHHIYSIVFVVHITFILLSLLCTSHLFYCVCLHHIYSIVFVVHITFILFFMNITSLLMDLYQTMQGGGTVCETDDKRWRGCGGSLEQK